MFAFAILPRSKNPSQVHIPDGDLTGVATGRGQADTDSSPPSWRISLGKLADRDLAALPNLHVQFAAFEQRHAN